MPSLNADASTSGVACKSPPTTRPKASSSSQQAPVVNLTTLPGSAQVHRDGSRFNLDGPAAKGFTRMGWVDPVDRWGGLISRELRAYALPFVNMQEYSRSRPEWYLRWATACPLMTWFLALEEHSFTALLSNPLPHFAFRHLRSSLQAIVSSSWSWLMCVMGIFQ